MRLYTFAFAWAWTVVTSALGLYSLIKSNQEKASIRAKAATISRTIHVNIDTQGELPAARCLELVIYDFVADVFASGLSATIAAGFISSIALFCLSRAIMRKATQPTRRARLIESALFAFGAVWMVASLIPYTIFVATRSAKVTAFNGSVPIPPALLAQTMKQFHDSPVYHDKSYRTCLALCLVIHTELMTFAV